jgi:tetratricopeptide (TPR) repeat protein
VRGEYEAAVRAYQTAILENPSDGEPYLRLARLYRDDLGDREEALRWFRRAIEEASLSRGRELLTRREMAELLMHRLGEPRRAAPELARLAEAFPDTPEGEWARKELARIKKEMAREDGLA